MSINDNKNRSSIVSKLILFTGNSMKNISAPDFVLRNYDWKVSNLTWIVYWKLDLINKEYSFNKDNYIFYIECKKYDGRISSAGITKSNNFNCGEIGKGVNHLKLILNFNSVNYTEFHLTNNYVTTSKLKIY